MSKRIGAFEIIDHGVDHSQYFQGCGTSGTSYTDVATGIGHTPREALEDALEQLASAGWDNTDVVDRCEDAKALNASTIEAHEDCAPGEACSACGACCWGRTPGGEWRCANVDPDSETHQCGNAPSDTWHEECELHYHVSVRVRALTLREWLKDYSGPIECYTFNDPVGTYLGNGKWEENTLQDVIKRSGSICVSYLESADLEDADLFSVPYCQGSDYSGTAVERSNHRVFSKEYSDAIETFGSFGSYGLVLLLDCEISDALIEALESLASYPLLDESDHSECEQEIINEGWESYGRSDFRHELAKSFKASGNEHAAEWIEDMPEDAIDTLYWEKAQEANVYPCIEEGESVVFETDRVVAEIGADDLPPFPEMPVIKGGCSEHEKKPAFGCVSCVSLSQAFKPYMGE